MDGRDRHHRRDGNIMAEPLALFCPYRGGDVSANHAVLIFDWMFRSLNSWRAKSWSLRLGCHELIARECLRQCLTAVDFIHRDMQCAHGGVTPRCLFVEFDREESEVPLIGVADDDIERRRDEICRPCEEVSSSSSSSCVSASPLDVGSIGSLWPWFAWEGARFPCGQPRFRCVAVSLSGSPLMSEDDATSGDAAVESDIDDCVELFLWLLSGGSWPRFGESHHHNSEEEEGHRGGAGDGECLGPDRPLWWSLLSSTGRDFIERMKARRAIRSSSVHGAAAATSRSASDVLRDVYLHDASVASALWQSAMAPTDEDVRSVAAIATAASDHPIRRPATQRCCPVTMFHATRIPESVIADPSSCRPSTKAAATSRDAEALAAGQWL